MVCFYMLQHLYSNKNMRVMLKNLQKSPTPFKYVLGGGGGAGGPFFVKSGSLHALLKLYLLGLRVRWSWEVGVVLFYHHVVWLSKEKKISVKIAF
jgi:hypothetical protein